MASRKELSEEDIKKLETMAGLGMTMQNMAAVLGISKRTLERRVSEEDQIFDALEKGRAKATHAVAAHAFELATNGKNVAMTMFWLKCRAGWSEVAIWDDGEEDYGDV